MKKIQIVGRRRRMLLLLVIGVPILLGLYVSLRTAFGGSGGDPVEADRFNPVLPSPKDVKKDGADKMASYRQADADSMRRRAFWRQDPNHQGALDTLARGVRRSAGSSAAGGGLPSAADRQAAMLEERLGKLQEMLQQAPASAGAGAGVGSRSAAISPSSTERDHPRLDLSPLREKIKPADIEVDPELVRLDGMLDKLMKLQQPAAHGDDMSKDGGEAGAGSSAGAGVGAHEAVSHEDAVVSSLPAIVQGDQVLVDGATIAMRLDAAVKVGVLLLPKDQLVYGIVSIVNDRLMIRVPTIRKGQGIYAVGWQVYDMDGLVGIHIPGSPDREQVRQSADQAIGGMTITNMDPSLAGHVADAGLSTARSLLRRRVRAVKVSVRDGYRVLLRPGSGGGKMQVVEEAPATDSVADIPDCDNCAPFMHKRVREDKMELVLTGIYLREGLLYVTMQCSNEGPIDYRPGYLRWSIRDRRAERRTAMQDLEILPLRVDLPERIAGDSSRMIVAVFAPFALPRDKELVVRMAERNGARGLQMAIHHKEILQARRSYE